MPFLLSCTICHFRSTIKYSISAQLYHMPFLLNCTICHFRSAVPYAISAQLYHMPFPLNYTICHLRSAVPYAISAQLYYMPLNLCKNKLIFILLVEDVLVGAEQWGRLPLGVQERRHRGHDRLPIPAEDFPCFPPTVHQQLPRPHPVGWD